MCIKAVLPRQEETISGTMRSLTQLGHGNSVIHRSSISSPCAALFWVIYTSASGHLAMLGSADPTPSLRVHSLSPWLAALFGPAVVKVRSRAYMKSRVVGHRSRMLILGCRRVMAQGLSPKGSEICKTVNICYSPCQEPDMCCSGPQ